MTDADTTKFTTSREEYEARDKGGERVVYAAALHLPSEVRPLCEELRNLALDANSVNVLNPIAAFLKLRAIRTRFLSREPALRVHLESCMSKLGEPVEGSTVLEMGWIQGFTFAAGMSAVSQLNFAISTASETLDRKSAYAMACFSLYVAGVSLVATVALGIMSLN